MVFNFTVSVEVERVEGKFASRDDLGQQILDEIDGVVGGLSLEGENGGQYEVVSHEVVVA